MLPPPTLLLRQTLPFYVLFAARSSTVLPLPTLLLRQMLPVVYTVDRAILYCATPLTLLLGQMLSDIYTVGCAILYCATPPYTTVGADAARIVYGWLRDALLCYPLLHYCWGRCCLIFKRLAARSATVLPPLHYRWGRCCPYCIQLAARSSTVQLPPTLLLADAARRLYGWLILYCATPPYTTVRADAARRLYGWPRDPILCYPPLHLMLGQMLPVFFTVGCAILYCATPPYATVGADATRFYIRLAAELKKCSLGLSETINSGTRINQFFDLRVLMEDASSATSS